MRTLYGRNTSINVQKALWALKEAGLDFEWVDRDGVFGTVNAPNYEKINPQVIVPTLDEDGMLIRQSNTIVRYVAYKYARDLLWPKNDADFVEANRWMDWQISDTHKNMVAAFWGLVRTPRDQQDPDAIAAGLAGFNKDMTLLNNHLADRPYVIGDTFSMGDIPPGALTHRYLNLPAERPSLPHLEAYYERLMERPVYAEFVAVPLA
jgi:glutathione S-transferase